MNFKWDKYLTDWVSISVSLLAIFISIISLIITIKFNKYQKVKLSNEQRDRLHNHFSDFLSLCSLNNSKEKYIQLQSLLFLIEQDLHSNVPIKNIKAKSNNVYGKFSGLWIYLESPQSDYIVTGEKNYILINDILLNEMTIIREASRNPQTGDDMTDIIERIRIIYNLFIDLEREKDKLLLKLFPFACRAKKRLRRKICVAKERLTKYNG